VIQEKRTKLIHQLYELALSVLAQSNQATLLQPTKGFLDRRIGLFQRFHLESAVVAKTEAGPRRRRAGGIVQMNPHSMAFELGNHALVGDLECPGAQGIVVHDRAHAGRPARTP